MSSVDCSEAGEEDEPRKKRTERLSSEERKLTETWSGRCWVEGSGGR